MRRQKKMTENQGNNRNDSQRFQKMEISTITVKKMITDIFQKRKDKIYISSRDVENRKKEMEIPDAGKYNQN